MSMTENSEYQYEMVVGIVADMIVEYLKTTDPHRDQEMAAPVPGKKEDGHQGSLHQSERVS